MMAADNLWTFSFVRISFANFLLFASLYVLFPVLPAVMSGRLGIPVVYTGWMFALLIVGMLVVGPFHAYIIETYRRKSACLYSFLSVLLFSIGYLFVEDWKLLVLLCLLQGSAFGIASTTSITIGIDVISTLHRSRGNMHFAWIYLTHR